MTWVKTEVQEIVPFQKYHPSVPKHFIYFAKLNIIFFFPDFFLWIYVCEISVEIRFMSLNKVKVLLLSAYVVYYCIGFSWTFLDRTVKCRFSKPMEVQKY